MPIQLITSFATASGNHPRFGTGTEEKERVEEGRSLLNAASSRHEERGVGEIFAKAAWDKESHETGVGRARSIHLPCETEQAQVIDEHEDGDSHERHTK